MYNNKIQRIEVITRDYSLPAHKSVPWVLPLLPGLMLLSRGDTVVGEKPPASAYTKLT